MKSSIGSAVPAPSHSSRNDDITSVDQPIGLFTEDGVTLGVGVQSSEERHAGRFALGETGTGGGDAGRRIHLVRAHCG
jgi:hypothetical protein